jgi:teichuronic acid biosynthesis glycosyltransferase TuaH
MPILLHAGGISGLAERTMTLWEPDFGSAPGRSPGLALAVADVNWFTTENLFREVDDPDVTILALRCMDYLNGWRKGIYPWSGPCRSRPWGHRSSTRDLVLPSGWMKRYPRLGMRPIARAIRAFWDACGPRSRRGLVMTYPHYLYLCEQVDPDVTLYYNIDDYALYWPDRADQVRALERDAVRRADATVCVARVRADALRAAVPEAAAKIYHIPHGTPRAFLAERPLTRPADPPRDVAHLPRPLLGYVGSIEERTDWQLMESLSDAFPGASIVVVGRVPAATAEPWFAACTRFLARPNVHAIGWRPQAALPGYYQAFDVILIPYSREHPFNQACSPTKIMDGMGSGRPIVATAIPECRLYTDLFDVAEDSEAFLAAVKSIVENGSDDGRAGLRHSHARNRTCGLVAEAVLQVMQSRPAEAGRTGISRPIRTP